MKKQNNKAGIILILVAVLGFGGILVSAYLALDQGLIGGSPFMFLTNLVLDLNAPSRSTMYNEPLTQHSTGMNFNSRSLTSGIIAAYVTELTRNNTPARELIRSDNIEDII